MAFAQAYKPSEVTDEAAEFICVAPLQIKTNPDGEDDEDESLGLLCDLDLIHQTDQWM